MFLDHGFEGSDFRHLDILVAFKLLVEKLQTICCLKLLFVNSGFDLSGHAFFLFLREHGDTGAEIGKFLLLLSKELFMPEGNLPLHDTALLLVSRFFLLKDIFCQLPIQLQRIVELLLFPSPTLGLRCPLLFLFGSTLLLLLLPFGAQLFYLTSQRLLAGGHLHFKIIFFSDSIQYSAKSSYVPPPEILPAVWE